MTPTPPQVEQTEREAFEAWAREYAPFILDKHDPRDPNDDGARLVSIVSWMAWQARASMQAQAPEVSALQREVEELRKLLIDIRAALPALRDNGVAKLYALAIDNALAASKAEVPNG